MLLNLIGKVCIAAFTVSEPPTVTKVVSSLNVLDLVQACLRANTAHADGKTHAPESAFHWTGSYAKRSGHSVSYATGLTDVAARIDVYCARLRRWPPRFLVGAGHPGETGPELVHLPWLCQTLTFCAAMLLDLKVLAVR